MVKGKQLLYFVDKDFRKSTRMSLLPYLLERRRMYNKIRDFGLGFEDDELASLMMSAGDRIYQRGSKQSLVRGDKTKFQINLDVHHFGADDITVKTVDGCIVVEGSHGERRDEHGWVSRSFTRRYPMPEGCDIKAVQSRLSSDGVLIVTVPRDKPAANERVVPIVHTGPIRKNAE